MSQLTPFLFDDQTVRAVQRDGEPWFVAADVCRALDIQNTTQAVAALDADEKSMLSIGLPGGATNAINESGLYALILRCRDAMTPGTVQHRFRKWVTAEVLPALRRSGRYGGRAEAPAEAANHDLVPILTKALQAQDALICSTHGAVAREHRARFTRILIAETSLSDQEIAARLADVLGGDMPEYVAWQRRKLAEGRP